MMARILVMDDEAPIRVMLRQILEAEGHTVVDAPDGYAGMHLFRDAPADLVITDIFMPYKEGIETIVELRKNFPQTKVLAISGGGQMGTLDFLPAARQLGAHEVLYKPFEPQELLETVKAMLTR
jgi:DNA-binding response OmpR family regulator